ncbi:PucR family transcriptional regulator [Streptococcus chenjunshii]|uniref:PucR family transcriptional regulator n=1 Tax=Streptococcus chenjunshii TaxID=2173853 RepID=A0A372KLL9_9STRE|nr:helix-turn-helix domain-containing protein [Streptococcus chenjunshii]AXQ78276.1 PucR family transcriptional regulator [Streptococcus chenjunshii]RFU50723.1 PucR family transcriptional regulator [Streptococcus chenjunshii]RFU52876.1 PucR family transcriptional regulator [Streptococcus chenjunshii]
MRLDNIINALVKEKIHIIQFGNLQLNISDMLETTWTDLAQDARPGILYSLKGDFTKILKENPAELTLLCPLNKEEALTELCQSFPAATIIIAEDEKHRQQIQKIIEQELHTNYVALERLEEAYHATFAGADFPKLAEIGSRIFDNPVFILDNLGNYIAFPPAEANEATILKEERQHGRISQENLSVLKKLKVDKILQKSGKPYLFDNPILNCKTLVDFIRLNGTVLGRLMIYEKNRPISQGDRIVFMHFAHLVALAFTHDRNYLMNKEAAYSYFLQALVDKDKGSASISNPQIEDMKLNVLYYKRVLVVSFIKPVASENNRLVLAKQLQQLLGSALFMFYENKMVFLVSGSQKNFMQTRTKDLLDFCQTAQLRLSASHIFYDFKEFRPMFQQASQVDQMIVKYHLQGHLFSYRYLASLITLDLHRSGRPIFIHPDIIQLLKTDQEKKSYLLLTLAYYILFNQNTNAIANQLWIHANTLRYRIKQIKKILANDLDDWLLLKTYYDSLVQLFQIGDISDQNLILKNDLHFL